jgi:hypothetical protein
MTAGLRRACRTGCVVLALFATTSLRAQTATTPTYRSRLLGVYNAQTGDVIEGADVVDVLSKTKAVTTATGTVSLAFLPDGGSTVRVQKIGFEPFTGVIAISPADTLPFTVLLEPITATLPTVVTKDSARAFISPNLQAFEERRRAGFGRFITPAELRKNEHRKMTDLIRALGVQVLCNRSAPFQTSPPCYAVSTRAGTCALDVFYDGILFRDPQQRDLERIFTTEVGAVEVYNGATTPPQYNGRGSGCGVVLFWTRER